MAKQLKREKPPLLAEAILEKSWWGFIVTKELMISLRYDTAMSNFLIACRIATRSPADLNPGTGDPSLEG
jgi:hypothetical protein